MTNAVNLASAAGTGFAFRNRIINGDMRIDQRNGGAAVAGGSSVNFSVDRWYNFGTTSSKFTVQQNAGSVTPPSGFSNYLGATSSSSYSVPSNESYRVHHAIEGFNVADLDWGTANAKPVTLSFWVRSSLTGTFGGSVYNDDASRSQSFSYSINSANTWEYKTVVIQGDTTGTWNKTNLAGIRVQWSLGAGSSYLGTSGVWGSTLLFGVPGQQSIVGTNGATFYLTGVQLEVGSVATSFERRPYGLELALCQRYYETCAYDIMTYGYVSNGNTFYKYTPFNVTKRTAPTMSFTNVGVNGFSNSAATNLSQVNGISWLNVANYTGAGSLYSIVSWAASAEL